MEARKLLGNGCCWGQSEVFQCTRPVTYFLHWGPTSQLWHDTMIPPRPDLQITSKPNHLLTRHLATQSLTYEPFGWTGQTICIQITAFNSLYTFELITEILLGAMLPLSRLLSQMWCLPFPPPQIWPPQREQSCSLHSKCASYYAYPFKLVFIAPAISLFICYLLSLPMKTGTFIDYILDPCNSVSLGHCRCEHTRSKWRNTAAQQSIINQSPRWNRGVTVCHSVPGQGLCHSQVQWSTSLQGSDKVYCKYLLFPPR